MLRNPDKSRTALPQWARMLTVVMAAAFSCAAGSGDADRQLEAAIHREMVMGDLKGAMDLYRGILASADTSRAVAARALLQTGECLEKLGQSEEAYSKYRRVVNDYADQAAAVTQSRVKLAAWSSPRNLKFEEGIVGKAPPGWRVPALPEESDHMAELRRDGCHSRTGCAVVMAAGNMLRPEGTLMQQFSAAAYRGKSVLLRAWLKLESMLVIGPTMRMNISGDRAQLWLKVVRPNHRTRFSDSMDDRPVHSTDWTQCEIAGEIDDDAEFINFGVTSIGGGQVWIDDVSFEVTPKK